MPSSAAGAIAGHKPAPSDVAMYDLLFSWAGSDAARQKILVDNPARLYGFNQVLLKQ